MSDAAGQDDDKHLHRFIVFSDGVLAIAITLLAIEIHPPHHWTSISELFQITAPSLITYAISFAAIGAFWTAHRRACARLVRVDGWLNTLNILFLGLVALLPAATALIATQGPPLGALYVYVGLIVAIGLAYSLMQAYAAFFGRLVRPGLSVGFRLWAVASGLFMPLISCLGAVYLSQQKALGVWGWVAFVGGVLALVTLRNRVARRLGGD